MVTTQALTELYQKKLSSTDGGSPLDHAVNAFVENKTPDYAALKQFIISMKEDNSPLEHLQKWRNVLALNLLIDLTGSQAFYQTMAVDLVKKLSQKIFWLEFQPLNALIGLNCYLTGLPRRPISTKQLASGAATLECGDHYPWADIPVPIFHAELGVLWAVLGKMTGDHELVLAAIQLADWQLNTLDHNYDPFLGLFTQEGDSSPVELLGYNYLLFHMVAAISDRPEMEYVAEKQLEFLRACSEASSGTITPLMVLLDRWMDKMFPPVKSNYEPQKSAIYDPHTALVGHRSTTNDLVCTLFGGHTGLGCYRLKDVEIMSYGPQSLPLGDCSGFGIERGVSRMSKGVSDIVMNSNEKGFSISGRAKLASQVSKKESFALFRNGKSSNVWMESKQHFDGTVLHINASFLGLRSSDQIAFVFFIKAQSCLLNDQRQINPRSLDRYEGILQQVTFQSEQSAIKIKANYPNGQMQLIPLSGQDSFWGSDFLLAYLIDTKELHYGWEIDSTPTQLN